MSKMPPNLNGNALCAVAVMLFVADFPAAAGLLQRWGVVGLIIVSNFVSLSTLLLLMAFLERNSKILALPQRKGLIIRFIGFGFGSMLLLIAQPISKETIAASAAAAMPIIAVGLGVIMGDRRLS